MQRVSILFAALAIAFTVTCVPLDPLRPDPFDNFAPDPNIFVLPPDSTRLVEMTTSDGGSIRFPVDIVLILLVEGAPASDADAVATVLGGSIVGQVPTIGLYQIQVDADSIEALDALIDAAEADPRVAHAGYDPAPKQLQECPADHDNRHVLSEDQCAFVETEYLQTVTMFDIYRPYLTLHTVTVGVVDSGLDPATGEFNNVEILNVNSYGDPPIDRDTTQRHGTGTCGMIAADDNGNSVNGLASRLLGDRLRLVVGMQEGSASSSMAYTTIVCIAGADIVNLSLGWEANHPRFAVVWHGWLRTMGERGDVLFCVAAGNEQTELTGTNYAPGGIDLPNVLTVAATGRCEPDNLWIWSNYGEGVDIAAPGEDVPTLSEGGVYLPLDGTSLSAPIVASAAAVLKSIAPDLTPRQLARYLRDVSLPINDATPFGRVVFSNVINQLLLDQRVGEPIESWIDPLGLGNHGAVSIILSRICPQGISFRIDGYGTHSKQGPEDEIGLGYIGNLAAPPVINIPGSTEDITFTIGSSTLTNFALGSYPLMEEPGPDGCSAIFQEFSTLDGGIAVAGMLNIETCRIEQRNPFNGIDPWVVVVNGNFEGVFETFVFETAETSYNEFDGEFNLPMLVTDDEDLHEYLEETCEGGLPSAD